MNCLAPESLYASSQRAAHAHSRPQQRTQQIDQRRHLISHCARAARISLPTYGNPSTLSHRRLGRGDAHGVAQLTVGHVLVAELHRVGKVRPRRPRRARRVAETSPARRTEVHRPVRRARKRERLWRVFGRVRSQRHCAHPIANPVCTETVVVRGHRVQEFNTNFELYKDAHHKTTQV